MSLALPPVKPGISGAVMDPQAMVCMSQLWHGLPVRTEPRACQHTHCPVSTIARSSLDCCLLTVPCVEQKGWSQIPVLSTGQNTCPRVSVQPRNMAGPKSWAVETCCLAHPCWDPLAVSLDLWARLSFSSEELCLTRHTFFFLCFSYLVYLCVYLHECMCTCVYTPVCMQACGSQGTTCSLLPSRGLKGLNSDCKAWQQVPQPAEHLTDLLTLFPFFSETGSHYIVLLSHQGFAHAMQCTPWPTSQPGSPFRRGPLL